MPEIKKIDFTPTGDIATDRVLRDIVRAVNALILQTAQRSSVDPSDTQALIRIEKSANGQYTVSFRSADGWISAPAGTFTIQERNV